MRVLLTASGFAVLILPVLLTFGFARDAAGPPVRPRMLSDHGGPPGSSTKASQPTSRQEPAADPEKPPVPPPSTPEPETSPVPEPPPTEPEKPPVPPPSTPEPETSPVPEPPPTESEKPPVPPPSTPEPETSPVPGLPPTKSEKPPVPPPSIPDKPAGAKSADGKPAELMRVPDDENSCIKCHAELSEPDQVRFHVTAEDFAGDAHWQKGVRCQNCHGGDPTVFEIKAHQANDDFRVVKSPAELRGFCANCHRSEALELVKGVHAKAGLKNDRGQGTPLTCSQCHADRSQHASHHILPAHNSLSPVFLANQVKTCGGCHLEHQETYFQSIHGQGMSKLRQGSLPSPGASKTDPSVIPPACADCHGAHGIYRAPDKRSTLHPTHVAATCGKCHREVEGKLQASVHGHGAGGLADRSAPGGIGKRKPSCTSCHQGHDLPQTDTAAFRLQLPNRCGNCHTNLSSRYAMSIHGRLTELGYIPAARCSDCHGAHSILRVSDPGSQLAPDHRAQTCGQCHENASGNFLAFDPHADHTDPQRSPVVHAVYAVLLTLLCSVFGFFGLHSLLWFVRGLVDVLLHGRAKGLRPGAVGYVRFTTFHRVGHAVLLLSFLGLAVTGLPLKYSHAAWARSVAQTLGGFGWTSLWHRCCAVALFACFAVYLAQFARLYRAGRRQGTSRRLLMFGPESPLPNRRDVADFCKMLRWFVGLGPKPTFDRWSYWEKFDFWGAVGDVVIIGFTGLVLWFPNFFGRFLPGVTLNIAQVIHSTQALLATGFVFAIHFFNTDLRPEKFPADMSVLTGLVSEEELREERPELYARWLQQGKLGQLRTTVPGRITLWLTKLGGFVALAVGLALLAGMITAALGG
jgi:cytochrome b subunit of formate dehydrogenase/outer membrane biosynthesis protein TonB